MPEDYRGRTRRIVGRLDNCYTTAKEILSATVSDEMADSAVKVCELLSDIRDRIERRLDEPTAKP